jgi:hypothetical protein
MKKTSHLGFELWTPAYVASILSLDHQSWYLRFPHINIISIQNYQGLILAGHFYWLADFFPQLGSLHEQFCGDLMYLALVVQRQNTYNCCRSPGFESWVWILAFFHADILGRLTRFKSGFHSSFWDFILYVEFGSEVWLVPFGIM